MVNNTNTVCSEIRNVVKSNCEKTEPGYATVKTKDLFWSIGKDLFYLNTKPVCTCICTFWVFSFFVLLADVPCLKLHFTGESCKQYFNGKNN